MSSEQMSQLDKFKMHLDERVLNPEEWLTKEEAVEIFKAAGYNLDFKDEYKKKYEKDTPPIKAPFYSVLEERVKDAISDFVHIEDTYYFRLNRVKSAFEIGTMSLDDFTEIQEDFVEDMTSLIIERLSNSGCEVGRNGR